MLSRKKFISIYISSTKLQVCELSSDKKKVLKFITLDLPQGLILNYKVSNPDTLAQALSAVWKKLRIKEKTVGIIIPEFSSQIKTFELPKIEDDDLDEAVRWHSVDFLPEDPKNFYLDWKIVGEEGGKYQILSAAVTKPVMDGYILAAEKAGLLPLLVETPSVTLMDLINEDQLGRFIVYQNSGETMLILTLGKRVIGGSVINPKTFTDLVTTIGKMIRYYSHVKVSEIVLGGKGITREEVVEIEKATGLKIMELTYKATGMTPQEIQEYLVPISSQIKEVYEPSDKHTINLLPIPLVQRYQRERTRLSFWTLTLFVSLVVWFSFMSTFFVYYYLGSRLTNGNDKNVPSTISQEQTKTLERIKEINALSQKVINISGNSYSAEKVLNSIFAAKPAGITVTDYFVDFESGEIRLRGKSAARLNLIDFKYKLEENGDFSLVSIPISSFENDKDFDFEMNFSYLPVKVKLQVKKTK